MKSGHAIELAINSLSRQRDALLLEAEEIGRKIIALQDVAKMFPVRPGTPAQITGSRTVTVAECPEPDMLDKMSLAALSQRWSVSPRRVASWRRAAGKTVAPGPRIQIECPDPSKLWGASALELATQWGVRETAIYRWRRRYRHLRGAA